MSALLSLSAMQWELPFPKSHSPPGACPWAAPGSGGPLIHLPGGDAWFAQGKDNLLIQLLVILSQRAKAHMSGLT